MKKLFRFLVFAAMAAGVVYMVKRLLAPSESEFDSNRSGVLPAEPVSTMDEAPLGGEISEELLKILVCPEDKGSLELVEDGKYLLNPRNGYKYPIRNGIPVMLIEEGKKNRDESPGDAGEAASDEAASDEVAEDEIEAA